MKLPIHEPEPIVCRRLRTKQAFSQMADIEPWQTGSSTTAVYWCLHTMSPAGPDQAFVHPHQCCEGRSCFEPTK